jgi:hypothetical protein
MIFGEKIVDRAQKRHIIAPARKYAYIYVLHFDVSLLVPRPDFHKLQSYLSAKPAFCKALIYIDILGIENV